MTTWNLERGNERPLLPAIRRPALATPASMPNRLNSNRPTPTMGEMNQQLQDMLGMLVEAEQRDKAKTLLIEDAATAYAELKNAQQEMRADFEGRIARLARRIEELESGAATPVAPRSMAAIMRDLVMEWFTAHPGLRVSPELVKLNLGDQIPAEAPPEAVASACKDLALAGKISGGGSNSKGKRGPSGTRGIYWLEEPTS